MNEHEQTLRQEVDKGTYGMSDRDRAVFVLGVSLALGYATRKMTETLAELIEMEIPTATKPMVELLEAAGGKVVDVTYTEGGEQ